VVWAFKAKGKELVNKKNIQLDPSKKIAGKNDQAKSGKMNCINGKKAKSWEQMNFQLIETECGDAKSMNSCRLTGITPITITTTTTNTNTAIVKS
jgi:hypothetical protein